MGINLKNMEFFLALTLLFTDGVGFSAQNNDICASQNLNQLKMKAQSKDISGVSLGENIIAKCPLDRDEALQWTSFLLALEGQNDKSQTIDRLLMPSPKGRGVIKNVALAKVGTVGPLREKLNSFDPQYVKNPKNRLVLGRALARSGEFDAAKKEYFTYISKVPGDRAARIEYLFLNVWKKDGESALRGFREALSPTASPETNESCNRGIELVLKLWPSLRSIDAPIGDRNPMPNQKELSVQVPVTDSASNSSKPNLLPTNPSSAVPPVAPGNAPNAEKLANPNRKIDGSLHFQRDSVGEISEITKGFSQVKTEVIEAQFGLLRNKYYALENGFKDSYWLSFSKDWKQLPGVIVENQVGWFAPAKVAGFLTGRISLAVSPLQDFALSFGLSRGALAQDIPLIGEDHSLKRDVGSGGLTWSQYLEWRGELRREGNSLPHEHHRIDLKMPFFGSCNTYDCFELGVPIQLERYQSLSPYYYHDNQRRGVGVHLSLSASLLSELAAKCFVELNSWNAETPASVTENYMTRELSFEVKYHADDMAFGLAYEQRATSSEFKFRKAEVPNTLKLSGNLLF